MAILKSLDLNVGITIANAYLRIERLDYVKNDQSSIFLIGYVNEAACNEGKEPVYMNTFKFTPTVKENDSNFVKQGYEYLKTLPEFEGAVDVIEEGQTA